MRTPFFVFVLKKSLVYSKIGIKNGMEVKVEEMRRARKLKLLTLRALAARAGVSTNTVWRMEQGEGAHPSTIEKVARALDIEPATLVKLD